MAVEVESPADAESSRSLPERIEIPGIRGEMLRLRPAVAGDLSILDDLDAFYNASGITGKGPVAERAIVREWVRRSIEWSQGVSGGTSRFGDAEARRTMAWSILTSQDSASSGESQEAREMGVIGMIFLIDIDGWSRSARIQVVLGRDFRGRGYSRDAMPRVMTYGFAPEPVGLGLHRIWVGVPEKNTRSLSVYQSLGFVPSGTSRDALWDAETGKYQDLIVMDTLVDEYDPIRSLDAFGMHVIEDNPGVREAMCAHEHSMAISREDVRASSKENATDLSTPAKAVPTDNADNADNSDGSDSAPSAKDHAPHGRDGHDGEKGRTASGNRHGRHNGEPRDGRPRDGRSRDGEKRGGPVGSPEASPTGAASPTAADEQDGGTGTWPYRDSSAKRSEGAWWRNLGRGRRRDTGGHDER